MTKKGCLKSLSVIAGLPARSRFGKGRHWPAIQFLKVW